jgi:photosystem II stability/assembly factor-like uncharacterized protein
VIATLILTSLLAQAHGVDTGAGEDLISVAVPSDQEAWAIGRRAVVRTIDGGHSWRRINPPQLGPDESLVQIAARSRLACVVVAGARPSVWHSTDGGANWRRQWQGVPNEPAGRLALFGDTEGVMVSGPTGGRFQVWLMQGNAWWTLNRRVGEAKSYRPFDAESGWTPTGGVGVSANNTEYTANNSPAPEGSQVAYFQGVSAADRRFIVGSSGIYRLRFLAADRRWGDKPNPQRLVVEVDGAQIGAFDVTEPEYRSYETRTLRLGTGPHRLRIRGVNGEKGPTAFVDAVMLEGQAGATLITGGGFEQPVVTTAIEPLPPAQEGETITAMQGEPATNRFVAGTSRGRLLVSPFRGILWWPAQTPLDTVQTAVWHGAYGLVAANASSTVISDDHGQNWSPVPGLDGSLSLLWVKGLEKPTDQREIVALGEGRLKRSTDGGQMWKDGPTTEGLTQVALSPSGATAVLVGKGGRAVVFGGR